MISKVEHPDERLPWNRVYDRPPLLRLLLAACAGIYLACLWGWIIAYAAFGDRWGWLFLLNAVAVYLFLPLPAVSLVAWLARSRVVWRWFGVTLAVGLYLYGRLFLPGLPHTPADDRQLTVMSYNLFGYRDESRQVITTIRATKADVIAFQELEPRVASAIKRELAEEYPYQVLDAQFGVTGMGVISRYPLRATGERLSGQWVGVPQVLTLALRDRSVTLLNFHAPATLVNEYDSFYRLESSVREREQSVQALADFVAARPEPLIALGDLNASYRNNAYHRVTHVLKDAWLEVGWGLGHTFPAAGSPSTTRLKIAGLTVPSWLVRIDYVFYSPHWQALAARTGPWDGISDHRPISATLALSDRQ